MARTVLTKIPGILHISWPGLPLYVVLLLSLLVALVGASGWTQPVAAQVAPAEDSVILGKEEPVELSTGASEESIEVLAKVDTGASYSSIDRGLAKRLGIDLKNPEDKVEIESSFGDKVRPLVRVQIKVAGKSLDTLVTVADRDELSKDMLLGIRDLEGFTVKPGEEQLTSPYDPRVESRTAALLEFPPPPPSAPTLLATLPLAAALVVAIRVLVGLKTFGLFAPVLLSIAFVQTGLPAGLMILAAMLLAGLIAQPLLDPLRLPRVARLAVLMAVVSSILLASNMLVDDPAVSPTWAAAFPVVVMAVIIERFSETWEQEGPVGALKTFSLTLLTAVLASLLLVAEPLRLMAERAPFVLGLLGIILSVAIGSYRGLRLTELLRFRPAAVSREP